MVARQDLPCFIFSTRSGRPRHHKIENNKGENEGDEDDNFEPIIIRIHSHFWGRRNGRGVEIIGGESD